jgi:hypothetical protein
MPISLPDPFPTRARGGVRVASQWCVHSRLLIAIQMIVVPQRLAFVAVAVSSGPGAIEHRRVGQGIDNKRSSSTSRQ